MQAGVIRVVFFGQDRGCYYREGNPVSDAKVPLDAQIAAQRRVLASIKPDEESTREIEATIALLEWLQANAEPLRAFVKAERASA